MTIILELLFRLLLGIFYLIAEIIFQEFILGTIRFIFRKINQLFKAIF
ncbi:hypothetical protein [Chryseobacterium defluvii]|uniref:Uncharacterized protein n=1 Tax=Chryseobacterium defluvii TaxID=160396 RepID=A0A495SDZ6_9FLAO|nr:hypothetical protein [Chryseobacterium defluvii]RKS97733.1 hypothetical protein BCF58_1866 [Chryseobacterium defluvii]